MPGLYFEVPPGLIPDPTPGLIPDPTPGLIPDLAPGLIPDLAPGTAEPEPPRPVRSGGPRGAVVRMRCQEIIDRTAERIAGGELGEGTRVASVRQLMREHRIPGSAASYIRRALRERGLIRLVPGLGYVVGAHDNTPAPPRPPVHDQITMIAMAVAERIRTGEIVAHQRLSSRQLMAEHDISRGNAWSILQRLVFTCWAYDTGRKGVRAAPYRDWPRQGASMALMPVPADRRDGPRSRAA